MSYILSENSLFSIIIKSQTSSSVKDETQPAGVADLIFTQNDANKIISELTNNQTTAYQHVFKVTKQEFKFNFYSPGGYFQGDKKTLEMPIFRIFDDENFKKAQRDAGRSIIGISKKEQSTNKVKINLNYEIEKKGWAVTEEQRNNNKNKIIKKIGLGKNEQTRYEDMLRIIKIMAFILFRERGQIGALNSEELLHREYGVICWCIVNMCATQGYKTKGNLLKLLQKTGYSNSKKQVSNKNASADIQAENVTLKATYTSSEQSLEFFVLAFFSGWINEELPGYTNWDHVSSGITALSPFHLPVDLKGKNDPDQGIDKTFDLYDPNNKTTRLKDAAGKDLTFTFKINKKIDKTSLGKTYTFDGNSLFTLNAKDISGEDDNEEP